jgi:hypothetical protein
MESDKKKKRFHRYVTNAIVVEIERRNFLYDLFDRVKPTKKDYTWEKTPGGHYRIRTRAAYRTRYE